MKLNLNRNRVSLGIRCQWGMRNALFFVAKDSSSEDKDKVLGVAMWMPPRPAQVKETWGEWLEGWSLWSKQVIMNLVYGRGGLNVKVCVSSDLKQLYGASNVARDVCVRSDVSVHAVLCLMSNFLHCCSSIPSCDYAC